MAKNYIFYYEPLGEIIVPEAEVNTGLSIYSPSLQKYTTEQIREMAKSLGSEDYNESGEWEREDALEFLAWWLSGDVDERHYGIADI